MTTALFWIYWLFCLGILLTLVLDVFKQKDIWKQVTTAMVIIPLALRVLLWK
jgi:hypothetical protein